MMDGVAAMRLLIKCLAFPSFSSARYLRRRVTRDSFFPSRGKIS